MDRQVTVKRIETINEFIDAIRLRVDVFILEQGFAPGWEPDEEDKISMQYIALQNGEAVATGRAREAAPGEFKIERMVTKAELRGKHIGRALLRFMLDDLIKKNPKRIWLRSQVQAQKFYETLSFKAFSKPFDFANVLHVDMEFPLNEPRALNTASR